MKTNKALGTISAAALLTLAMSTSVLADGHKGPNTCTYAVGGAGSVIKDGSGDCVRLSGYDAEKQTVECGAPEKEMEKPMEKAEAAPAPAPAAPVAQSVSERVTIDGKTLFAVNKANLTPAGQAAVDNVVEQLRTFDNVSAITISGHTDSTGSESYNQSLSERRASTVRDYMISRGVNGNLVTAVGQGESSPVADNGTKEGRAQNRRVEIDVTGTKIVMKK